MSPLGKANTLLLKLLVAYLLPTLLLLGAFGMLAHRVTEQSLEESLGRRLIGIAQATATQLRAEAVAFLGPGDDRSRTARRLRAKLRQVKERTHAARIFVIDGKLRSRCDTRKGVRIGDRHYHAEADRAELERVFNGRPSSSVLFVGADGRAYKTGYAPLADEQQRVIAAVGVEGSAEFFTSLERLRTYLLLSGAVIAALVVLITIAVARRITQPLRTLASAAARIGGGDLDQAISTRGGDEVGLLAATMNQMRRDLRARDQELQLMLSGIAHEVRNPLGGIALFAGLLREEVADDPEQLEMVQRIERELQHLKRVVNDFLAYARRVPPERRELALPALLEDVLTLVRGDAEAGGVELVVESGPATLEADPDQLRRALLNLTRNAIQACSGATDRHVWIRCGADDDTAWVEVADDGCGIPAATLERIFTPFFTTREKGTGLGLALTRKTVEEHGGELNVESEEGRGTTVRMEFSASGR